ncbi:hypothetical protein E8E14_000342 [Neopestalotiopsis sp. 37M]|nr:hypothetical protein E8E14_000342 [Neopestalotiopsis sp. 37M]
MGVGTSPTPAVPQTEAEQSKALTENGIEETPVSKVPEPDAVLSEIENAAKGQLKSDEITALQLKIADTLADFLKDMEPYKHIFPDPVWDRFRELEKLSKAIQALDKESKDRIERESCIVRRDDMRNWPKNSYETPVNPAPIIEAFYDNFEEAANSTINAELARQNTGHSLQRVVIKSDILHSELEKITSIRLRHPLVVPPPFKMLVHFHPQIDVHLSELENGLREADLGAQNSNIHHTDAVENDEISTTKMPTDEAVSHKDTTEPVAQTQYVDRRHELRDQSRARINHLKCLRDFIHSDLKHLVALREKVETGTLEKISFPNLWYLFKPGDVVVSTRNHSKVLYKIYSVTGGQKRTQVRSQEDRYSQSYVSSRRREPHFRRNDSDVDSSDDEDLVEEVLHDQPWGVGTWVSFKLDGYSLESNGRYVGAMNVVKKIKPFDGEIGILDLDVYPVQFHPENTNLLRRIEERGRKYLNSAGHRSYDGYTVPRGSRGQREELQGDVFVDLETYLETHTRRIQQLGKLETSPRDSSVNGEVFGSGLLEKRVAFTNHEIDVMLMQTFLSSSRQFLALMSPEEALSSPECLQLMPSAVPGYAFSLRKWYIDRGREARDSNFDDLVIPDSFRDMLAGLVENHTSRSQRLQAREMGVKSGQDHQNIDVVRGKGQGLIILLHGPPGSGKTSTAETIAAFTQRPLYSITCGDLGLKPHEVELALQQHTKKASKWGCVLLLDEADVFLMQRDWQNVERNALVSVLLRQLEYYSGILFLTTNRPGVIDEAFISRIHISLRYPLIDLAATKRMWTNIMNRIERDNETSQIRIVFDHERLLAFAEQQYIRRERTGTTWNGRQIRNAIQTAIALGTSQRMRMLDKKGITPEQAIASGKRRLLEVKLTRTSLHNISQSARAFEDYMQHLRGNDSDLARQAEVRDDHFDSAAPRATKDYGERQSLPKRADSFGIVKGTSAAKTSTSAGKARQSHSRKARNVSEDDDDDNDDLNERSDDSSTSDGDDSDGY